MLHEIADESNNLVEIKDLSFSIGDNLIFNNLDLNVQKGSITAIMGRSGIGKTTLLRLISRQTTPDKGRIWYDGDEMTNISRSRLYDVRRKMGLLFQSGALFTDMNVFDNVAFALREHTKLTPEIIHTIVMLKLEAVNLRSAAYLMPNELSGGMARRAALARTLALDPSFMMYDEPFVGQDPITVGVLVKLIANLNQALKMTSLIVSHDVPEVMSIADHVYLLSDGKIIAQGSPKELQNGKDDWVQSFLTGKIKNEQSLKLHTKAIEDDLLI